MSLAHRKSLEPWLYDEVEYYPHQIEGVRQMLGSNNWILADDMGLGKSLQALTVFASRIKMQWAETAIVVCPVSLRSNWLDEVQKFTRIPATILGERYENDIARTLSPTQRDFQLEEFDMIKGPKILICNYEMLNKHVKQMNELNFHFRIADEAHYLKNPNSVRTKNWHRLQAHYTLMLTGTPMLNKVDELWSLLHSVDPFGWPKYWTFMTRYCVFGGYKDKQIVGTKNQDELMTRLHRIMIRRMKKDVLSLPEVQIIQHKVDLLPEQRKLYDQVSKEMLLDRIDAEEPEEVENGLTKFLRLKQICGTTVPFMEKDFSGKLDAVVEDVLQASGNGHKCVVFTQFRNVLDKFAERLDKAAGDDVDIWEMTGDTPKSERGQMVKDWAAPEKGSMGNVIVCMLQVAGVGLNMTAGRHGFFIDKLFTPGMNQQAIDRMHRIGASETQPVQIHEYITRATIESRVEQILTIKSNLFGTIVNESDFKKKLIQALQEEEDAA